MDKSGSLAGVKRPDYLPFGDELYAGTGGRTTAQGYGAVDNVRQKFTGYERDGETGLDFAQARMYASVMGRFVSTDPVFMSKDRLLNPQEIDLYAYCQNNPPIHTDPDGKYFVGANGKKVQVSEGKSGLVVGKNATPDLKRMAALINASGSEKATSRFLEVANSVTRVNFKISPDRGTYTDPLNTSKSGIMYGITQPHDKSGKPLMWSDKLNNFNGTPEYTKDGKGNMVYKEVTITLYEGSLTGQGMATFANGGVVNDPKITTNEALVVDMSHEETHTTDQPGIDKLRNHDSKVDAEATPSDFQREVDEEIKKHRKQP